MDSMFEILMGLSLFNGVSRERMAEIVGKAKFHFLKYLPGETIVSPGDPCTHVRFVISGNVRLEVASPDGKFKVVQTIPAPDVIAPSYLFGRATTYPCTVTALDAVGILQISKADYLNILSTDHVFLLNFLNTLSMNAQKAVEGVIAITGGELRERIAFWVVALTQPSAIDIRLECRQRALYSIFGVQRSSFISTLDAMKADGLIDYDQNAITFTSRRRLLDMLHTTYDSSDI